MTSILRVVAVLAVAVGLSVSAPRGAALQTNASPSAAPQPQAIQPTSHDRHHRRHTSTTTTSHHRHHHKRSTKH